MLTRWTYVFQCKLHRINVCSRQKAETVAFWCIGIVMCSRISIFPSWVFNTERTIQCKAHPPNPRTYHCSAVCCKREEIPQSAPSPVNKATQGGKKHWNNLGERKVQLISNYISILIRYSFFQRAYQAKFVELTYTENNGAFTWNIYENEVWHAAEVQQHLYSLANDVNDMPFKWSAGDMLVLWSESTSTNLELS